MLPRCDDQGIGVIPWSPLARGRLTRPWDERTARSESDEFGATLYSEQDKPVVDAVLRIAQNRGVAPARIALAWVLSNPVVTSPIVGATKPHHLDDAVAALSIELDDAEMSALEESYRPHDVIGLASPSARR